MQAPNGPSKRVHTGKPLSKRILENWQMYLFLLIPMVWLIVFKYWPMYGVTIAFKKYKPLLGILDSPWVGFEYLVRFFQSYQFNRTVFNTVYLSMMSMIITFPIPIIFALLLNSVRSTRYKGVVENVTYMPHFISTVVMVGILRRIFDINTGMINNLVELIPGVNYTLNMFMGGHNFRVLYILSGIWQSTGWGSIIYMAALSSVDPEQHEAATIDGASRLQRVLHVDIPAIIPTITVTLILRFGSVMGIGFDKAYLMQNDTNLVASEVIATYVYKAGLTSTANDAFSYATAIGLFNSGVNLFFVLLVNKIADKVNGKEWAALMDRDYVRMAEMMLDQKPDVLLLGGSGTLTLATPALVRKYALPTIKTITRMCKEAGIPSMLHSCGRSMAFLEMLYNETDLDCINPLEEPPMGDVDLAEVKRLYGDKLCLMGNLNTTNVLIEPKERVAEACRRAIDTAAKNGRFILSTGDQLGRDTPDENIFAMVETAKTYGKYN